MKTTKTIVAEYTVKNINAQVVKATLGYVSAKSDVAKCNVLGELEKFVKKDKNSDEFVKGSTDELWVGYSSVIKTMSTSDNADLRYVAGYLSAAFHIYAQVLLTGAEVALMKCEVKKGESYQGVWQDTPSVVPNDQIYYDLVGIKFSKEAYRIIVEEVKPAARQWMMNELLNARKEQEERRKEGRRRKLNRIRTEEVKKDNADD